MLNFDLFDIPWFKVRMFKLCAGYAFKVENIFKTTNLCGWNYEIRNGMPSSKKD